MSCSRERGKSESNPTTTGAGRVATRTTVSIRSTPLDHSTQHGANAFDEPREHN
jgi:hypothetical protein